ncbi:MAG: hypothetical protein A2030_11965 [Chloroflexi bacterium RBG_19FT_COMBO_50_10]|nr:MAG: hypothetical protein A2030_11965 [Chloroflexi bacterium RBG_19FT_COMBO_50_10]
MSESVRAVERALGVLLCFTPETPELTMTQIAEQVGIHKSTTHRLLATLEKQRFVQRDPDTGIYRLGIRLLQMAYLTLEHIDLRRLAAPIFDFNCLPMASNAVASPAHRLTRERMMEIGPGVVTTTREISQEFTMSACSGAHSTADVPAASGNNL